MLLVELLSSSSTATTTAGRAKPNKTADEVGMREVGRRVSECCAEKCSRITEIKPRRKIIPSISRKDRGPILLNEKAKEKRTKPEAQKIASPGLDL